MYSQDQKFVCFWNASSPFSTPFYSSLQIFKTKTDSAKASEFNDLMIHFLNFEPMESGLETRFKKFAAYVTPTNYWSRLYVTINIYENYSNAFHIHDFVSEEL